MNNKLKIHSLNIDHWFQSEQDMELYRRISQNTQGNSPTINIGSMTLPSPGSFPDLMTEDQLVQFLRIPEITNASDYHNVVKNLIRMRNLPRIQICNKLLFPKKAVLEWVEKQTVEN